MRQKISMSFCLLKCIYTVTISTLHCHGNCFRYEIQEQNLIDEYNDDVCCVVCAIPGAITKDDLCCSSSGHNDYNIRECISDEEHICSLMVNIQTYNHKECILEVRLYFIPSKVFTTKH